VLYRFIGMWVLRRAYRILTADDPRPLAARVGAEGKRILVGAAITLALLFLGVIALIALLVALAT
jgi:hypothetical protein